MLSLLAPGYLVAATMAAVALTAAHFIVRRQPRAMVLPTARFVPEAPALTTGWARVPTDLVPLVLRVLCVMLAGLALSGPFLQGTGSGIAKVILADRSRAVAHSGDVTDSVAAIRAPGDVVIGYGSLVFEETARGPRPRDTAAEAPGRGSLSAGLVAAVRAASRFHDRADSVELVIVSSFATEQLDDATARVRKEWPGRARLTVVPAPTLPATARTPVLTGETGDPLAAALALAKPASLAEIRIARGALSRSDSLWTAEVPGRVLLHWPRSVVPAGFVARAQSAPVGGLLIGSRVVIATFQRRWQYVPGAGSKPIAWWIDGDVAGMEIITGRGCVRSVAVPVSAAGDFVLRPDFHAVLREIVQPCGGAPAYERMPAASLAMLGVAGRLAPSSSFAQPRPSASPVAKWLMLASIACVLLELLARDIRAREPEEDSRGKRGGLPTSKAA